MLTHIRLILLVLAGLVVLFIAYANIRRVQRERRYALEAEEIEDLYNDDDILGLRRVVPQEDETETLANEIEQETSAEEPTTTGKTKPQHPKKHFVLNIFAKKGKKFSGYELLQSLLTVGMRFGNMNIFHRHREKNGKGPILFSLASATEPGTFDIQKIGAYQGEGLVLFMARSDNATIDVERYKLMVETAQQLVEDLDGELLNQEREPIEEDELQQYETDILSGATIDGA